MPGLCEGVMAPNTINRNANKRNSVLLKLRQNFVIESQLIATDRTPTQPGRRPKSPVFRAIH
jgi:hypothetical protein